MVKQLDRSIVEEKAKKLSFVKALIIWEKYGIEKGRKIEANTSLQAAVSDTSRKRSSSFFSNKIITNNSEGQIDSRRKTEEAVTES